MKNKLNNLIKKSGITQYQLAIFLNIDKNHLSKIKKGEIDISLDLIQKLSNLFCVPMDYFTNKENDNYTPLNLKNIKTEDLKTIADINKIFLDLKCMVEILNKDKLK